MGGQVYEVPRRRKDTSLPAVRGLVPFPCEATIIGDPDRCVTRVWDCPGYRVCLEVACRSSWRSFTCRACPVFQRYFNAIQVRIVRKVSQP